MQKLLQDLRFAIRQLRKSPGFALTTILTLALGIGATTAIFSLINAVLLRPLPFPESDRLVYVQKANRGSDATSRGRVEIAEPLSYPDFADYRAENHCLSDFASYGGYRMTLSGTGDPERLEGQAVSADFFRVLSVNPMLGRGFIREDEKPGMHVVVLSHELWASKFGAARDIVGGSITLDGARYTVIGVMPPGFLFPIENPPAQFWVSMSVASEGEMPVSGQRGADMLDAVGRLRDGIGIEQARADLSVIARTLAAQYPDTNKTQTAAIVEPLREHVIGSTRPALRTLAAAVGLLLLIACANVAGLMLARASRRRPEIALRAALGATRLEILRQIVVESVVLSVVGGAFGTACAALLLRAFLRLAPQDLPRSNRVSVDLAVLIFAVAVSVVTGLLFGSLPAWHMSRLDPSLALREGARGITHRQAQHRLHNFLVVAETAVSLTLLIGAGLFIRSFVRMLQVDPGFDPRHVLTAALNVPESRYPGLKRVQFYDQVLARMAAMPGVESVAAGFPLPFTSGNLSISFSIKGRPVAEGDHPSEALGIVTENYFHALRIPVVAGREFTAMDVSKSNPVIILNQAFARKYFSGEDPLGKQVKAEIGDGILSAPWREVVGIVGDVKQHQLAENAEPRYYLPYAQAVIVSPRIAIRTASSSMSLIGPLRATVAELDSSIPVFRVHTAEEDVSLSAAQPRFQTLLLTFFAVMALLLSAVGLYAVLSYMVAQRTLEIGLRLALGAQREDVLGLILRRGLLLAATGLAIGVVASLLLTQFMKGMLYGVRPFDPLTFVGVSAVLLVVSAVASTAPAYRAARLDPMQTLREQ